MRAAAGPQASFTVRKMSFGHGVERIFPVNSRVIDRVELMRSSKVRRAKLYYLRGLRGKAARLKDVEREQARSSRGEIVFWVLERDSGRAGFGFLFRVVLLLLFFQLAEQVLQHLTIALANLAEFDSDAQFEGAVAHSPLHAQVVIRHVQHQFQIGARDEGVLGFDQAPDFREILETGFPLRLASSLGSSAIPSISKRWWRRRFPLRLAAPEFKR